MRATSVYFYSPSMTNGCISQALRDSCSIICGTRQNVGRTETNDRDERDHAQSTIKRVNVPPCD